MKMRVQKLILLGLTTASLLFTTGQAHAFNLLVAVGNPSIQLVMAEDGTLQILQIAHLQDNEEQAVQVSALEPAAGE